MALLNMENHYILCSEIIVYQTLSIKQYFETRPKEIAKKILRKEITSFLAINNIPS